MGGLDVQTTIGFGKRDFLAAEISRILGIFAEVGGLFCTSHFVQDHCSIDELTFAYDIVYRLAARMLNGRKVDPNLRCIIIPGSQKVYMDALKEGLIEIFIKAGAAVSTPTCGPCLGGYMGILAAGEKCVSTTNRNFVGRMGHTKSEIYLANPAVAAASAVLGRIASPEELA
jgi:aconitase A